MRPQEVTLPRAPFFLVKMGEFGRFWLNGVKSLNFMPKKYVI